MDLAEEIAHKFAEAVHWNGPLRAAFISEYIAVSIDTHGTDVWSWPKPHDAAQNWLTDVRSDVETYIWNQAKEENTTPVEPKGELVDPATFMTKVVDPVLDLLPDRDPN